MHRYIGNQRNYSFRHTALEVTYTEWDSYDSHQVNNYQTNTYLTTTTTVTKLVKRSYHINKTQVCIK